MKSIKNSQTGFMLPTIIITSVFMVAIALIITKLAVNNFGLAVDDVRRLSAQFAADAGIDQALVELNNDNSYTGTTGQTELFNDGATRTTYKVTISGSGNQRAITSTGRTFVPATSSTPRVSRTFTVGVAGIGPLDLGEFSIVTGAGGLFMENSSKILDGDVFVNGEILMENTAQIGTASNPTVVRAANQLCPDPADSTYPSVCTAAENTDPITLNNSAHIYAEVQATHQSNGAGMTDDGLVSGSPAPEDLPAHDRDAQKTAATNNMTGTAASCDSNGGTRTILANTKITGDVSWKKKCKITMLGDMWITGSLEMTNSAELIVDDSIGDPMDLPTVMVDGVNGIDVRNSTKVIGNSDATGARLITYWSTASCQPNCDATGSDLYNSRDVPTILMNQSFEAPESLLYARWTQLKIVNSGDIGALVGQTVLLQNSTTVTFGAGADGGGGGGGNLTFTIDTYRRGS